MKTKKRVFIIIDGSNFYFKLKELGFKDLLKFNFSGLIKMLNNKNYQLTKVVYYIGKVKTSHDKKTKKLHAGQQRLFAYLRKYQIHYSLGYLLKTQGKFHEKGVDVNMAVDILVNTYENMCDHFIILSSDTDLLPAIKKAREKNKTVEYIGFSHQPSLAMIAKSSISRLLTKEDLSVFF
jgi:uncharacterized LabA/DUF88 family protein